MKNGVRKEQDNIENELENNRYIVIQAAIVRIMKARQSLQHQTLVSEVVKQLSSRFNPNVRIIKKSIDALIEKEYLKRSEGKKDNYEYIS